MELEPGALNDNTILRYLGYVNQKLPEGFMTLLSTGKTRVCAAATPRTVYRQFPLEDGRIIGALLPLEGNSIRAHLSSSHGVIVMAATLGAGVDRLLQQAEVRDMSDALILDACASAAIEAVCDGLEARLRGEHLRDGHYLTDRFSAGYGDFPLDVQGPLCDILDTQRKIGLTVTKTSILTPRKSVTALMGIADVPQPRRGRCESCSMFHTCAFRERGTTCGA